MNLSITSIALTFLLSCITTSNGFVVVPSKQNNIMLYARAKGKASKNKNSDKSKAFGGAPTTTQSKASSAQGTWTPISGIKSMKDIDTADSKIQVVETNVPKLIDPRTNPTGAVCVTSYNKNLYCFSASCASCQIPMTKAKLLPPNDETNNNFPRIQCNFCSATYNVRTGEQVKSDESSGGLFSGIVKNLYSAQKKEDVVLPTYDLGEKDGKVLIKIP